MLIVIVVVVIFVLLVIVLVALLLLRRRRSVGLSIETQARLMNGILCGIHICKAHMLVTSPKEPKTQATEPPGL